MGLLPNVKDLVAKMDTRFAELKAILEDMLAVLKDIRAELSDR